MKLQMLQERLVEEQLISAASTASFESDRN